VHFFTQHAFSVAVSAGAVVAAGGVVVAQLANKMLTIITPIHCRFLIDITPFKCFKITKLMHDFSTEFSGNHSQDG
jgi:hypothetical protein